MSHSPLVGELDGQPPATRTQARLALIERNVRLFCAEPIGVIGVLVVASIVAIAVLAPLIAGADPIDQVLPDRLRPPSSAHWFGTDSLGRDVFARAVYGARPSILIVFIILAGIAPAGLVIGAGAGLLGGWADAVLMRISDVFMAFPRLILALATAAVLGAGPLTMIFAIGVTGWPAYARIARSEAVTLRRAEFVAAAETIGASRLRILFHHILPICLPAIIVRGALDAPGIVLIAAGLGFLGAGLPPPTPEWGAMVADGRAVLFDAWWISTIPGIFILLLSIGFNLVADALRDVLDPLTR
jgi:peptide/nickel transport system permease protein